MKYFTTSDYSELYKNRFIIREERRMFDQTLYPVWADSTGRVWNVFQTAEAVREFRAHLDEAIRIIDVLEEAEKTGGLDELEAAMQQEI